ncbi:hypothetical protein [Alicyclobacillus sp. SP_1]|uniref:hypothetical protein n=1 Tax=Alicyclobacillus sp. SP_1 TaxID=2942475 RepID=UPI0035BE40D0
MEPLLAHAQPTVCSRRPYCEILVVGERYRQQREMYPSHSRRVDDRIVSITQPDVRPMVRGKATPNVEFGATVASAGWTDAP